MFNLVKIILALFILFPTHQAFSESESAYDGSVPDIFLTVEGSWIYTWPDDYIPHSINDLQLLEFPDHHTKSNWGKPVAFKSKTDTMLRIFCSNKYQEGSIFLELTCIPVRYTPYSFHELTAGIGVPESDSYATVGMIFHLDDIVYSLEASNKDNPSAAKKDLLYLAEQIYLKNKK